MHGHVSSRCIRLLLSTKCIAKIGMEVKGLCEHIFNYLYFFLHVSEMYVFVIDIKLCTFYILDLQWNRQNQQGMDTIIF